MHILLQLRLQQIKEMRNRLLLDLFSSFLNLVAMDDACDLLVKRVTYTLPQVRQYQPLHDHSAFRSISSTPHDTWERQHYDRAWVRVGI
jgi:hypothetical protein